jgi:hypothetical protein
MWFRRDIRRPLRVSGVGPERFSQADDPPVESSQVPVVMLPTRLLWHKGLQNFVDAARHLRDAGVNYAPTTVGKRVANRQVHTPG